MTDAELLAQADECAPEFQDQAPDIIRDLIRSRRKLQKRVDKLRDDIASQGLGCLYGDRTNCDKFIAFHPRSACDACKRRSFIARDDALAKE